MFLSFVSLADSCSYSCTNTKKRTLHSQGRCSFCVVTCLLFVVFLYQKYTITVEAGQIDDDYALLLTAASSGAGTTAAAFDGLASRNEGLNSSSPVRIAPSCTERRWYVVCEKQEAKRRGEG